MTKRHMGAYLCAMLLFGTLGLFVRQAHVAGDVLAFLRTLIGAAFLGVLLLFQRHRIQKIGGRQLLYVLLSAAFWALTGSFCLKPMPQLRFHCNGDILYSTAAGASGGGLPLS